MTTSPQAVRPAAGPSVARLFALVRPFVPPLLVASALLALQAGITLAAPRLAGLVIDSAVLHRDTDELNVIVGVLLGLFAVRALLSYAHTYLMRATGARVLRSLRNTAFRHLVTLGPPFHDDKRVGELLSRIGADLSKAQGTLTSSMPEGLRATITLIGTLIIIVSLDAKLTLVALCALLPIPLVARLFGRPVQRLNTDVQDRLADSSAIADEALAGIRTVKSYNGEGLEQDRYAGTMDELVTSQLRSAHLVGAFYGLMNFAAFAAFAVVLWFGARGVTAGDITPGEMTAFLLYMFAIAGSVGSLGRLYAGFKELRGVSARVFEILDTEPAITDAADATLLHEPRGQLDVDGVRFAYPGSERHALREVSVRIDAGQMVAFVGPSGAGKSTLFALLLRFYDPTAGHIRFDGTDLRALQLASLRAAIAVVPQEIVLFSGTIADNIRYGSPDATDDQVRAAAVDAGAAEFIEALPAGYAERVGERGVKLSAGQRQRVAIARAFLKKPAVLLLDEATSALDADSEAVVAGALERLSAQCTTLVIAHRLATARRADKVVIMDGGKIQDTGSHDELRDRSELYRRYWELQSLDSVKTS